MGIAITDYPELRFLCWQRPDDTVLSEAEAVSIYRRNWRHLSEDYLIPAERALIDRLVREHRGGVPFVPLDVSGNPMVPEADG